MCVISLEIVLEIDADFDTKLYKDFVSKLSHIFLVVWEWIWLPWLQGMLNFHLRFLLYPPPSPKIKSQVKSVMEGWFPQTFWKRVRGNFLGILEDCVKGFVLN